MRRVIPNVPRRGGLVPTILTKGTSSPQFRPLVYGGIALLLGSTFAERALGVNVGWVAVVAGGLALVGIVYYVVASGRRARNELAQKRSALLKRFEDPHG